MNWHKIPCSALIAFIIMSCGGNAYERTEDGIIVRPGKNSEYPDQSIRLQVISEKIIRVTAIPAGNFPLTESLMAVPRHSSAAEFTVEQEDDHVILNTSWLNADVSLKTGQIIFTDPDRKVIVAEKSSGSRTFRTVMVQDQQYLQVRQQFDSPGEEALYGLGANQTFFMNLKGKNDDLFQYNTLAKVPFIISTRNYGILWDNNSRTKFGDIRDYNELSAMRLFNSEGTEGGLTATYARRGDAKDIFTVREEKEISYEFIPDLKKFPEGYNLAEGAVTWEGFMESDTTGVHQFVFTSAGYARLWVDGTLLFDRWRQCWNASANHFDLQMEKGKRYQVKIEWIPDGGESFIALRCLTPINDAEKSSISFWSEVAEQADYYFIAGASMDEVIGGYRTVTGKAPVMPLWAMGFWQSRERYKTQEELLGVVREFRKRNIPLDNIVLDWQYWPLDKWGDHDFDATRFPDPSAMISTLHEELKTNIMISVWPKYYVGTENYETMNASGWLYERNVEKGQKDWIGYVSTFYDAFNADARKAFWEQINMKLYSKGVDAWWLDATEPDICSNLPMDERKALMNPTALGPADRVFNAYALVQARGVWEGQRATDPDQRVFILTRSAFTGLQRYAAANWSGDIASRWHDMAAQIPCGLNVSMAGIPYWTMDIGGFAVEGRYYDPGREDLEEWRELMTRWYQFGAFVPLFRSHGQYPLREVFNIAPESHPAYRAIADADRLRYRLMPYIYSLAGNTYLNDYTIMRGLAMDFAEDRKVWDIGSQYMFGPSFMVCPVCEYKARSREVYLPEGCGWYDFYTGRFYTGGQTISADAPYSSIPLFVREGSLIPFGPEIEYTSEKPADPLTLLVYGGRDAELTLYEDEGVNNNYEKGAYSLITFRYDDSESRLNISAREGEFQGMLGERTFNIIRISADKPFRLDFNAAPHRTISYVGSETEVQL